MHVHYVSISLGMQMRNMLYAFNNTAMVLIEQLIECLVHKPLQAASIWRNIPFKIQSGYFPYRKINFRVGNQLTGSVIVGHFQTSSLSAIFRV